MKANYCIKCGKKLAGGSFCAACGEPIAEFEMPDEKETEDFLTVTPDQLFKKKKRKKIRWCPNCWEQIPEGTDKCPKCGYVLGKE